MGGFSTVGVARHTQLLNKEVGGVIDHADRSVTRSKLEYPTVDVPFLYLFAIGKAKAYGYGVGNQGFWHFGTVDSFADKRIEGALPDMLHYAMRMADGNNTYTCNLNSGAATADFILDKRVSGTVTTLATEAVDIVSGGIYWVSGEVVGTTLKGFRDANPTATPTLRISATDTSFASGAFGGAMRSDGYGKPGQAWQLLAQLRATISPAPTPIAYFEVPVVGSGTVDDPFRAQMPEEIVTDPVYGRRNRLAVSYSALIKTDRATGKPVEYVAIVRVFDQPDRDPALRPISDCLSAIRGMAGVRQLSRGEAIKRAKQLDPDLMDPDFVPIPATRPDFEQVLRDYIAHREAAGVRPELIDEGLMRRYLQEDKGW